MSSTSSWTKRIRPSSNKPSCTQTWKVNTEAGTSQSSGRQKQAADETWERCLNCLVGKRQSVSQKGEFGLWHTTGERSEWHLPSLLSADSLPLSLSSNPSWSQDIRYSAALLPQPHHTHSLSLFLTHTHTHTHTPPPTSHTHIPTSHSLDFPSLPFCLHRDPTPPPATTNTHTHTHFSYRLELPGWHINFWHTLPLFWPIFLPHFSDCCIPRDERRHSAVTELHLHFFLIFCTLSLFIFPAGCSTHI